MNNIILDYIIIGAGISGINTADKIRKMRLGNVIILEKSRGIGGRMATRRTLNTKFDHGAQFYKDRPDFSEMHDYWIKNKITHQWFTSDRGDHWCSQLGMTALAKAIAKGLTILLEKQVHELHFENNLWEVHSTKGEKWPCRNLIITSPLPQALKLFEGIDKKKLLDSAALSDIEKITYTKALIGLVTLEEYFNFSPFGYQEFLSGDIFSITDQKIKGVSEVLALTITMSPHFSENHFEHSDEFCLKKMLESIKTIFPNLKIKEIELKKWRYCKAETFYRNYFLEVYPKLYLIGDAFGGPSLSGSIRSSNELCNQLIKMNSKR